MSNISFNEKAWGASGEFLEASSFWNQMSSPMGLMAVPVPALGETLHFQVFACACPLPEMPLPVSTPMSAHENTIHSSMPISTCAFFHNALFARFKRWSQRASDLYLSFVKF